MKQSATMKLTRFVAPALAAVCMTQLSWAADPVTTDGDKYKVRMENDRVRVLEYEDLPGAKTLEHTHPAFVLYAVSPFKRKISLPGGKVLMREFKAGDVMWSDEQTHIGENIGSVPTHVIMIELKGKSTN